MKLLFTIIMLFLSVLNGYGQGENNIWTFGWNYSLDFNTSPPTVLDTSFYRGQPIGGPGIVYTPALTDWEYYQSSAVCNANGQLLFMVKMKTGTSSANSNHIWDRYEHPIPGTNLLGNMSLFSSPVVIPHPGNGSRYYIFYIRSNGLVYSLFDMSLNGGLGDIVAGQKNISLTGWNMISDNRMTAIKGCNGVWLVARSYAANEYLSFHVGYDGLDTVPVASECGNLPLLNYGMPNGSLQSSSDGKLLVSGFPEGGVFNFPGGIELYDFEKCSGKVTNARLLETNQWIYAGCFSPDNSKLYTTENDGPYFGGAGAYYYGKVYQYDLNQPTLADIVASKTLIIINPHHWNKILCVPDVSWFGDMRLGPDGKIYILDQHPPECPDPAIPKMTFHIIHQPNNVGLGCIPQTEALFSPANIMANMSPTNGLTDLPKTIIRADPPADTFGGHTYVLNACFADSFVLIAPTGRNCYQWDNGTKDSSRTVYSSGTYHLTSYLDCSVIIDTYNVFFTLLPDIPSLVYGCEGEISFRVKNQIGDTTTFRYQLMDENNGLVISGQSNNEMLFTGLDAGMYSLHITNAAGCDTNLPIELAAYPSPDLVTVPADTTIRYGDSISLHVSGANLYIWWPASMLDSATKADPIAKPIAPTVFTVMGINAYGCTDTGHVRVDIDYNMPDLVPNAFSPNGDGLNDIFRIEGATYQTVRAFNIFNRFGQRIFSTMDAGKGWDGTQNGQPCETGTYHYLIQLDYPGGKKKMLKGDVLLIR